jgi:hypothetical protein
VRLYRKHPERAGGNSYARALDHIQPPLAAAGALMLPLALLPIGRWIVAAAWAALLIAQLPMALRIVARCRELRYLWFVPFGATRALARAVGMLEGIARTFGAGTG